MNNTYRNLTFALLILLLNSCTLQTQIISETDLVHNTERSQLKLNYPSQRHYSPMSSAEQSIVKISSVDCTTYEVYDVIHLYGKSFNLKNEVYIIIDDQAYPLEINTIEREHVHEISENTENIMTADSSSISVVTGYSEDNRKISRVSYNLPQDFVDKMAKAEHVIFRYYAAPDMISLELKGYKLKRFKQFVNL